MFFPWLFEELQNLKPFKEAAHILAKKEDWPMLYNIEALNNNKVLVEIRKLDSRKGRILKNFWINSAQIASFVYNRFQL